MTKKTRILVVDDSEVIREFLTYIFSSEDDLDVIGTAKNGLEAAEMAFDLKPDVITMDIEMPVMNGFEATEKIMSSFPIPIIIVTSSFQKSEVEKTFLAMEAGALAIFEKPYGAQSPEFESQKNELLANIRTLSEVKMVTRRKSTSRIISPAYSVESLNSADEDLVKFKITAIGISTGGPTVLNTLFSKIPKDYCMPIVVAQHIPEGFMDGLVEWLRIESNLPIEIARAGTELKAGVIYFNPPESFLKISRSLRVSLETEHPEYSIKPSVSFLFKSLVECFSNECIGILLTGMGKDGANELLEMKKHGALTIAQDKESSVVHGMPGEAVKLNACKYILNPEDIARKLTEINNVLKAAT